MVCRWAGSSHDSTVFTNSALFRRFERNEFGDSVLLADSAYGAHDFVCKPLREPRTPAEKKYQKAQIKTRNSAERAIGLLKKRFPCLAIGLGFRKLSKIQDVIVACCVLHNMCIMRHEREPPDQFEMAQFDATLDILRQERQVQIANQHGRRLPSYQRLFIDTHFHYLVEDE